MRAAICLLVMWCGMGVAVAAPSASARSQMEASMLVDGQIEVDAQGVVERYSLERQEKLPDNVVSFIEAQIAAWRFEPTLVDGRPAPIRNRMGLLLVAVPDGDGTFRVEMRGRNFYPAEEQGYELEAVSRPPPSYPRSAAERGVAGTVYLVLRIDAGGRVEDVAVEQVNLRFTASRMELDRWRGVLAKNAAENARNWTYRRASRGAKAGNTDLVSVRVPVAYSLARPHDEYGSWQVYSPGPRQPVSWLPVDDDVSPDALVSGGLYPVGMQGVLRLLPAQGG